MPGPDVSYLPSPSLQLSDTSTESQAQDVLLNRLWDASTMVINGIAPNNGYIVRTHLLIASSGRPFGMECKGDGDEKSDHKNIRGGDRGFASALRR